MLIFSFLSFFETKDRWISSDKFKHLFISYVMYSFSYDYINRKNSAYISFSIGLFKELYDGFRKEKFSYKDMFWNILGIYLGFVINTKE
ncbi:MAG: hypothetical protein N2504_05390 [candidate division WOR-3 bacterium]|nr:hypothetical protein [candidate division WOR-3 bacterium]MCX7948003.1 hypothetical protein [candidate division WOR-3 bacterium]MDW8151219.1 hypothetical protein [candidate division WOR-3 bacterium]